MDDVFNDRTIAPIWTTCGRTALCEEDQPKDNAVDNYNPTSCLPLMWILLTVVIAERMHGRKEHIDRIIKM